MKKKFLLTCITAMISIAAVFMGNRIVSNAATDEAILERYLFHDALLEFTDIENDHVVAKVKVLSKKDSKPSDELPHKSVGNKVTAYYDSGSETMFVYSPEDTIYLGSNYIMFGQYKYVEEVYFGDKINTSRTTSLASLFSFCTRLRIVEMSHFDTSNVTNMHAMFDRCCSLRQLDLRSFKTSKVEDMIFVFAGCENLTTIRMDNFDTSNVTRMQGMFDGCKKLEYVNISHFNFENVTDTINMFRYCSKLKSVDVSGCNPKELKSSSQMFGYCTALKKIDLRNLDMSACTYSSLMFRDCKSLNELYAPKGIKKDIELPKTMYIDDNADGIPDSETGYTKLPVSDVSHRYIDKANPPNGVEEKYSDELKPEEEEKEEEAAAKTEETKETKETTVETAKETKPGAFIAVVGKITYNIDENGNATAVKIKASGKVTIDKVTVDNKTYPVIAISKNAAKGNKKIKSLTVGKNVTLIDKNAFNGCKKLKKVVINAASGLKVNKGAFKKINKEAVITVKGQKGKSKKALIKAIKKQTNATVK